MCSNASSLLAGESVLSIAFLNRNSSLKIIASKLHGHAYSPSLSWHPGSNQDSYRYSRIIELSSVDLS